jgi:hypothetical protein
MDVLEASSLDCNSHLQHLHIPNAKNMSGYLNKGWMALA